MTSPELFSTLGLFRTGRSNFKAVSDIVPACAHEQADSESQVQTAEGLRMNVPVGR